MSGFGVHTDKQLDMSYNNMDVHSNNHDYNNQ